MPRFGIFLILLPLALIGVSGNAHPADAGMLSQLPTIQKDTTAIAALLIQAKKHIRSDINLADSLTNEALLLLDGMIYPEGLASCLIQASYIKVQLGDLDAGVNYGLRATRISEGLGNRKLISESYNQRYLIYFQKGEYDSATIAAERSLAEAERISYETMIARGHQNFGILNSIKGNHSKAIEHFLQSEKYYQALNDKVALAFLLGNLGVTFEEAGNLDKSLEYMLKELSLSIEIDDQNLQAWSMTNIGSVYSMLEKQDSAFNYYLKSLKIAKAVNNVDLIITNFDNLGTYWSATKHFDSATYYLMSALRRAEAAGFNYQEVYVIGHLAENYYAMGKRDSALIFAEKQLALAKSQELPVDQKLAYALIAKIHANNSQYHQAFDALTRYNVVNDSLYNEEKTRQIENLRESYEAEKKDQQIASLHQQKQTAEFKRNTYVFACLSVIVFLLVLYSRQRLISRKDQQLLQKGQEVERMKSRFFGNISHEFRTPLTLILGPIDILHTSIENEHLKFHLDIMRKNANRMLTLTNQLLDLSKLEDGSLKLTASKRDVILLVKGVVMSFNTVAEIKNISLISVFKNDSLTVWLDSEKIETVIINLLSNAIKFTPGGGTITVSQELNNGYCFITISDDGEGIPEHDINHVFDRFYQGTKGNDHAPEGGTGIGLALAKELVELHHGTINAKSLPGEGTTVTFTLPLGSKNRMEDSISPGMRDDTNALGYPNHHVHEQDVQDLPSSTTEAKPLILLIEDNNDVMAYLKSILSERYEIAAAYDGGQGISMALETIPDLIVCDVMMPVMDGYDVCAILKQDEKTSHIPLILLTARSSAEDRIQGLRHLVDDYVAKPFIPRELEVRIENLIESRKRLRKKYNHQVLLMPEEIELTSIDEAFLNRVKHEIEINIVNEHFSVEQLGKEIGMSRSQMHRKLHALTNQSASMFIRTFRLLRAKSMIEQSAGTIAEISYAVGFTSPSYFSRCFLKHFGYSPTDLKSRDVKP